ncbi:hypothetical protein Trydic_g13141 [Trypoxylus dichotomus]
MPSTSSMFLKILHWNCDGISTKVEELMAIARRDGIHVILFNELRITVRFKLRIRGYVPYVLNNNAHGGVAALVREDVPHRRVELQDVRLQTTEAVAVQLADSTILVAFYKSPQKRLLQDELEAFFDLGRKIVLAGDFNATHATWGCHRNNVNGNTLHRYVTDNNVILHDPGKFTHFPHNGTSPNTLDLVIVQCCRNLQDKDPYSTVGSCGPGVFERTGSPLKLLLNEVPIVSDIPDIETLDSLVAAVATCQWTSAISSGVGIESGNCFSVRAAARIEWNSSGYPQKSNTAYASTGTRPTTRGCAASIRGTAPFGGSTSTYDRSGLESTQSTTRTARQPCRIEISRQVLRERLSSTTTPRILTPQQKNWCIRKYISKSSSLKAPGNDNIQNHVLKHIPRKTFAQITYIFNAAFKLQHFPSPWKTATVIPVPKPGKEARLATSYRQISLLPAISKIFEKILLRHVDKHTNDNSVMPPEQFGFRR